jgi:hypothetical protein
MDGASLFFYEEMKILYQKVICDMGTTEICRSNTISEIRNY